MRCLECGAFSFRILCANCLRILSEISPKTRYIDDLKVIYFYDYSEIKRLILSKHHTHGSAVFKSLGNIAFKSFARKFYLPNTSLIYAVPLDDHVRHIYSHTAILAKALKTSQIKPSYNTLRASNSVSYAGKSLEFRKKNPRGFKLEKKLCESVILVDDIITTGLSMAEARKCLENNGVEVLFGIVLADARL